MEKSKYNKITIDNTIIGVYDDTYKGYWDGKYIDDLKYKGVYHDLKTNTKQKKIFKWNDADYKHCDLFDYTTDNVEEIYEESKRKIDNEEDQDFDELLWTHNMPLSTFYQIFTDEYMGPVFTNSDDEARGLQFRYGVDSQYGDVIFIMKPGFYYKYNKNNYARVWRLLQSTLNAINDFEEKDKYKHITVSDYIHYALRDPQTVDRKYIKTLSDKKLKSELKKDANLFKFRIMSQNIVDESEILNDGYTGNECFEDSWSNTWCNHQLQLYQEVSFRDVSHILLPEWIKDFNFNTEKDSDVKSNIDKILKYDDEIYNTDEKKHLIGKYKYYNIGEDNTPEHYYTGIL
jgi:hypothetical protein